MKVVADRSIGHMYVHRHPAYHTMLLSQNIELDMNITEHVVVGGFLDVGNIVIDQGENC